MADPRRSCVAHPQPTKNGRDHVVLIAAEDLESIDGTMELLTDPEAQQH